MVALTAGTALAVAPAASARKKPPPPPPQPQPPPQQQPPPQTGGGSTSGGNPVIGASVYWGAYVGDQFTGSHPPWDWNGQTDFQNADAGGKAASLLPFGAPFSSAAYCGGACTFPPDVFDKVRQNGTIPWFSWQTTSDYSDAQIAAGAQDSYITAWAQAAKAWGHPFFLRFDWEMDGDWFPWGMGVNGNTPAGYIAMWRHVHDIFTSVGATNATWVWCPNVDVPGISYRPLADLYPGSSYVDWTCLDGYNGDAPWTGFHDLFASDYATITSSIAPGKPMAIGETGSTEAGGSKAQWIRDMLSHLTSYFPAVHAVLWYDISSPGPGGHNDWPIESSAGSRSAFSRVIEGSTYAPNAYAALSTNPIAPPR